MRPYRHCAVCTDEIFATSDWAWKWCQYHTNRWFELVSQIYGETIDEQCYSIIHNRRMGEPIKDLVAFFDRKESILEVQKVKSLIKGD